DTEAIRPRRARDHRREQLVRRPGDDGVRRPGGLLGRRGRVDRRLLHGQRPRPRARREPRMIDGVRLLPLERHGDERGWLYELRRDSALPAPTHQTNISFSRAGVVRGLHYHERGQSDLFACLSGTARVIVLDRESGETMTVDIGDDNPVAVWIPGHLA